MSTIIRDPSQNVALRPGDVIYLTRDQKVFMVLGATPSPGSIVASLAPPRKEPALCSRCAAGCSHECIPSRLVEIAGVSLNEFMRRSGESRRGAGHTDLGRWPTLVDRLSSNRLCADELEQAVGA